MSMRRIAAVSICLFISACNSDAIPGRAECGAGTHDEAGHCVPDVSCGADTHVEGARCVPDVVCGPGTHPGDGGICLPDPVPQDGGFSCARGTHEENSTCVADPVLQD